MLWFSLVSFQRAGQEISLYIYWQSMLQTDAGAHPTLTQVTAASLRFIIYFVHLMLREMRAIKMFLDSRSGTILHHVDFHASTCGLLLKWWEKISANPQNYFVSIGFQQCFVWACKFAIQWKPFHTNIISKLEDLPSKHILFHFLNGFISSFSLNLSKNFIVLVTF